MQKARRVFGIGLVLMMVVSAAATAKPAKPSKSPKATEKATAEKATTPPLNACGCYRKDSGGCVCTDKKAKCECPGDCEPVGCDEKRQKELEREMATEVKRAQDEERRRKEADEAEEAKRAKEFQQANAVHEQGEADAAAAPESPPPKSPKPSRKTGAGKPEK